MLGVSIGAPGRITELDETVPWWRGTADAHDIFGRRIDPAALRGIPVQIVVGDQDPRSWPS